MEYVGDITKCNGVERKSKEFLQEVAFLKKVLRHSISILME